MAVDVTITQSLTVVETPATQVGATAATKRRITHDQYNTSTTLGAATTPPATEAYSATLALVAGTLTIDLTALTAFNGRTLDATGLKLQAIKLNVLGANELTVAPGASNGYPLFGGTNEVDLPAGSEILLFFNDGLPDVASGDRTITFSTAGSTTDTV